MEGDVSAGAAMDHPVYRLGVREMSPAAWRRVILIAGVLYSASGISVVQVWAGARAHVLYPAAYLTVGLTAFAIGIFAIGLGRLMPDDWAGRHFSTIFVALLFFSAPAIDIGIYFGGVGQWNIGTIIYMLPPIFAFYVGTRRLAVACVIEIGVAYAILLAVQRNVVAPVNQWFFLMIVLSAAGWLVGRLMDERDRLAASEHQARAALADANRTLETRINEQVEEMARLGRLRRFLSPQVADAVLSSGGEDVLAPHRREVAVFFIDLRRFTSFTSRVEPEDVVDVLREYYDAVGALLNQFQATIGAFTGDGIMAYFGDPVPCDSPPTSAAELALEVRGRMDDLCSRWTPRGHDLSYGIGLAFGHATLGVVGFGGRSDYTPLGTVVNLGARLCGEAGARQILVDQRLHAAIEPHFATQPVGTVALKGFPNAVAAFEVLGRHARR